ncbi:MAG: azurin [Bacteroidota bacterium]
MNRIILNALMIVLLAAAAVSCGGDKQSKNTAKSESAQSAKKSKDKSDDQVTLVLKSDDKMKFDKKILSAKPGQKVKLILKHEGKLEKSVMGHNFVLLKQGTNIRKFSMKAASAVDNDYIPEGDEVIAHTKMIGGGETTSITFTAPEAGMYDYICSFPAHSTLMKGKFVVE